jgi:hypothetical protein
MSKEMVMDEVLILKFFETGPIEKVEVVFNIVSAKMRERLSGRGEDDGKSIVPLAPRKRSAQPKGDATREVAEAES